MDDFGDALFATVLLFLVVEGWLGWRLAAFITPALVIGLWLHRASNPGRDR